MSTDHNPVAQTITIPPITPASPTVLVDASFLHTLGVVEHEVAHLKIADGQGAQHAADLQQRLTMAGKKLELARKEVKAPFLAKCAEIDEAARNPAGRIEAAKNALKRHLTNWEAEQQRIARDAEIARQKELARLEAIRVAEEAEAKRKADELAKQLAEAAAAARAAHPEVQEIDFGDSVPSEPPPKTETEKAIEAVKYAPAPVAPKPVGVRWKVTLVASVTDISKVPEVFVVKSANMAAIRATFCNGWKDGDSVPVCDGVKFEVNRTVESAGRGTF